MVTTLNIPKELRDAPRWGSWHYDAQQRKVPDQEVNQLGKWKNLTAVKSERKAFVFAEVDPWFSIDIDFKNFPSKKPSPEQQKIIDTAVANGMYVERSVSGLGYHLWARANKKKWPRAAKKLKALVRNDLGIEIYAQSRYFIMTGNADKPFENGLPDATKFMLALFARYEKKRDVPAAPQQRDKPSVELVQRALACISPDVGYHEWKEIVGFGLQDWDYEEGFKLWDEWSSNAIVKTYPGTDELRYQWDTGFQPGGGVTISSVLDLAKAYGFSDFRRSAKNDFENEPLPAIEQTKTKPARELVTLDANKIKPKKIDWVWQDYLARGTFHMIVGVQGDGKSVFVYGMVAALTGGKPFINGVTATQTGRVLLIQGEEDPATIIVPRLQAAGADLKRVSIVSHAREHEAKEDVQRAFSLQDDVNSTRLLLEQATMMGEPVVAIVIDPITAYMAGKKKIDAFRDDEMRSMLMPWVRLISKHHVVLIVVAHLNKTSGQRAVHRVAQSAAATAAARAVYLVGPANGVADFIEDPQLKIFVPAKYNLGKYPAAQLFGVDGYLHPETNQSVGFVASRGIANVTADDVLSSKKSSERSTPLRDKIWDCVNAGTGGMMRKQIAESINAQMESAGFQSAIRAMLDQELLVEVKRKLYTPRQLDSAELLN